MGVGSSSEAGEETQEATVLVVEDQEHVADLYENVLSERFAVKVAQNGGQALMELDDAVDVVLLDRRLPGMEGDEVLEQIQSQDVDCHVAMVSAVDPDFDVIEMGFDDYLVKPIENDQLVATVERLLALDEYESLHRELSSKLVKKNILEAEKSPSVLDGHTEYQQLTERVEVLEKRLDEIADAQEFDDRLLPS